MSDPIAPKMFIAADGTQMEEKAAMESYRPAGECVVAATFGLPALNDLQRKICAVQVYREMTILFREANPKPTVDPLVKALETFKGFLQRAFGYAKKAGIGTDKWPEVVQFAANNPKVPADRAPRVVAESTSGSPEGIPEVGA